MRGQLNLHFVIGHEGEACPEIGLAIVHQVAELLVHPGGDDLYPGLTIDIPIQSRVADGMADDIVSEDDCLPIRQFL